jgi:CRISPR/Cas system-associated endonuclease/helicase Cas3
MPESLSFPGGSELEHVNMQTGYTSNENMLVCAPTGAGKTNIAMIAILREIGLHMVDDGNIRKDAFKIVYVAPMKALAAEVARTFGDRLANLGIQVHTTDVQCPACMLPARPDPQSASGSSTLTRIHPMCRCCLVCTQLFIVCMKQGL